MFGLREKAGPYRHDLGAALLYDAGPGFRTMLDALITDPIDAAAVLDPIFFHHGRLRDAPAAACRTTRWSKLFSRTKSDRFARLVVAECKTARSRPHFHWPCRKRHSLSCRIG